MSNNLNNQKPYSVNQVEQFKPNVPKTASILTGYIANSFNGGHNRTIAWKKVMAGEKHYEYGLQMNIKTLTPKTPTYQNLKCTVRAYFVPNSRVWKNAEEYTAQKGGASEIKITEIPNIGGKSVPLVQVGEVDPDPTLNNMTTAMNTELWRDTFISSYLPRLGRNNIGQQSDYDSQSMPPVSVLPLRGRIAIYNDMERNKEYDEKIVEYNNDTVTDEEWNSYLPFNFKQNSMRAKRENSYYTNYRTEYQGFESTLPDDLSADQSLVRWSAWESKIAEARSEAEDAQSNPWNVIAKIRGSKVLSEGKVQKIGEKTFNLNYAAITQNTYNTNTDIQEDFRVLGQQGAYSYTEIYVPLYAAMEFKEEGYIHVIANVTADSVFEKGLDRNELNITPLDEYRPDLKDDKLDVIYECEFGNMFEDGLKPNYFKQVRGFKRKYSEYFKLPNIIAGDLTTDNYYKIKKENGTYKIDGETITNKTFQFFEKDAEWYESPNGQYFEKNPWQDYTDILINKNQAIMNTIKTEENENGYDIRLTGQNQIFFLGVANCIAELPIDQAIKDNFTTWGEH